MKALSLMSAAAGITLMTATARRMERKPARIYRKSDWLAERNTASCVHVGLRLADRTYVAWNSAFGAHAHPKKFQLQGAPPTSHYFQQLAQMAV
jgi:hypothetical protein